MARRLGKRKRPDRGTHMIKEQLKIEEGIFENRTMMCLWRMFNHGIITKMDFVLKTGKEADVYIADAGPQAQGAEYVILKIFRIETSSFPKRMDYMIGDPRFEGVRNNIFAIVNTWCRKEYGNLMAAEIAGVHAPRPYYFRGNVLAIEFIGEDDIPARTLKESQIENPAAVLDMILEDMKKLYGAQLVHGDVSEYNILMKADVPYMIDFGQAVLLTHPKSGEFLERDIRNILGYFSRRYKLERDADRTLEYVTGKQAAPAPS